MPVTGVTHPCTYDGILLDSDDEQFNKLSAGW